jgi:hypothetical protein
VDSSTIERNEKMATTEKLKQAVAEQDGLKQQIEKLKKQIEVHSKAIFLCHALLTYVGLEHYDLGTESQPATGTAESHNPGKPSLC